MAAQTPYVFQKFFPTIKRKTSGQIYDSQAIRKSSSSTSAIHRNSNPSRKDSRYSTIPDGEKIPRQSKCSDISRPKLSNNGSVAPGVYNPNVNRENVYISEVENEDVANKSSKNGHHMVSMQHQRQPAYVTTQKDSSSMLPPIRTDQHTKKAPAKRLSQIDLISTGNCQELQDMMKLLNKQVSSSNGNSNQEEEEDFPALTPEPDWMKEYGRNVEAASPDPHGYKPKHCWCNRCQMMYRMHKTGDPSLSNWGNYPCFQW